MNSLIYANLSSELAIYSLLKEIIKILYNFNSIIIIFIKKIHNVVVLKSLQKSF